MKRLFVLTYGVLSYGMFLGVFLYAIGFMGGLLTPTSLDGSGVRSGNESWQTALLINITLVFGFAVQHSGMARPAFKRWLTRWIPEAMERSTYVLVTNILMCVFFWQWRPMGGVIWNVESGWGCTVIWTLFAAGWMTIFVTTCLINHFDLFGLRQSWLYFRGLKYKPLPFMTPGPYKFVRHPLYIGWLLTFWATPTMTTAHLVFAVSLTAYILIAIRLEERDLVQFHPAYEDYRRSVPMLIPKWSMTSPATEAITSGGLASAAETN